MAINYDDFLNLSEEELEKCQDLIENLILVKEKQNLHYLSDLDEKGTRKAFRLDKKTNLSKQAWEYFWDNVHPFMLEEKDLPFFKMIHALDHFEKYEKAHARQYGADNTATPSHNHSLNISFTQEVILNALKSASAIESLLEDEKITPKIRQYLNENTALFYQRFGVSQDALDVLIKHQYLDLDSDDVQQRFYGIDSQEVATNPGLVACYQAALRHQKVGFNDEHIAQQIVLIWKKAPLNFLQSLPEKITQHLDLHQVILRLPQKDYDNEKLLKLKLITWLPDSYGAFFNTHPDNFTWSLGLRHDNWAILEKNLEGVTKGLINAYDKIHCQKPDWTFENLRHFLSRVHEDNPEVYEKLIQRAQELNENSNYGSVQFEKTLNKILLHENLSEKLLHQDDNSDDDTLSGSGTKLKI
jgi:hypothetical protein